MPENNENVSTDNNLTNYLPNLPQTMPQMPFDFVPPLPQRRFRIPVLNNRILARRIYLEMVRATKDYGDLEAIAPQDDTRTINNLKNQMQILSLSMLNIYSNLNNRNSIPFFLSNNPPLPNDYARALREMYNRVYHIYELTLRLYNNVFDQQTAQTLLIIILNLKSQLNTLNNLARS